MLKLHKEDYLRVLLFTGAIFVAIQIVMVACGKSMVEKLTIALVISLLFALLVTVAQNSVSKLQTCNSGENFHFEVTKPKLCQGGAYMYSSGDPELKQYCDNLLSTKDGLADYSSVNCGLGYEGRPVHFERTPMSDAKWENPMAKENTSTKDGIVIGPRDDNGWFHKKHRKLVL